MCESTVEDYLVRKVAALGGEVRKVKWPGRRGAPDRLVLLPQKVFGKGSDRFLPPEHFFVELKAPGKKPPAYQRREHERLRRYGFRVEVVDTLQRVEEILR